jgi:hypothetical protein
MSSIITNAFRIENLKAMQAALVDTANNSFYLCLAKPDAWDNEAAPDTPKDSLTKVKEFWDGAFMGKKVLSTNTRQGIYLRRWVSGQVYDMYRDDYDGTVATKNLDGSDRTPAPSSLFDTNFYVINPATLGVYKCLYNRSHTTNLPVPSTDNSFLSDTSSNVVHGSDGYDWKFMYTVTTGDAVLFNTPNFVAADTTGTAALVDGGIYAVVVSTVGVYTGAPTVVITGDGSAAAATAHIAGGGVVWVEMTNPGSGYTHATISFTGGTGAGGTVANAIMSPIGGHGTAPADELGGIYLMIQQKFIADETGYAPITNDFRQIGFLKNPTSATVLVTAPLIQMCGAINLAGASSPGNFAADALITGSAQGAGKVVDYNTASHVIRYIQDWDVDPRPFIVSGTVTDTTNTGTINSLTPPDVDPYTGALIYFENRIAVVRDVVQTEDCRLIVEF